MSCSDEFDSGADKKQCMFELALATVAAILVFVLFHFWGSRSNLGMSTPSLFVWIGKQWLADGGDFSHGWIMPLVSIGVVWIDQRVGAVYLQMVAGMGLCL